MAGDAALSPSTYLSYLEGAEWTCGLRPVEFVNTTSLRVGEYEAFKKSNLDPYVAMRSAYFEFWLSRDKERSEPRFDASGKKD